MTQPNPASTQERNLPPIDQVIDPQDFAPDFHYAVDDFNQAFSEELTILRTDPLVRQKYPYLQVFDRYHSGEPLDTHHLRHYAGKIPESARDPELLPQIEKAYAIRLVMSNTSETLQAQRDNPDIATALTAFDRHLLRKYAAIEDMFTGNPETREFCGRLAQIGTQMSTPEAVIGLERAVSTDNTSEQTDAVVNRVTAALEAIAQSKVGTTRAQDRKHGIITYAREQLLTSTSWYKTPQVNQLFKGAFAGKQLRVEGARLTVDTDAERFGLNDVDRVDGLESILVNAEEELANGKQLDKNVLGSLLADTCKLIQASLKASGTEFGHILYDQLEANKRPIREGAGTDVKILGFETIINLSNRMIQEINRTKTFKDEPATKLAPTMAALPEAFRRLMFVAAGGKESLNFPEGLNINQRFTVVDRFARVIPEAREAYARSDTSLALGATAIGGGTVPSRGRGYWDRWKPGAGTLS